MAIRSLRTVASSEFLTRSLSFSGLCINIKDSVALVCATLRICLNPSLDAKEEEKRPGS